MNIHSRIMNSLFTNTVVVTINNQDFLLSSFTTAEDAETHAKLVESVIITSPKGYALAPLADLRIGREAKYLDALLMIHKGKPTVKVVYDKSYINAPIKLEKPITKASTSGLLCLTANVNGKLYLISSFKCITQATTEFTVINRLLKIKNGKILLDESDIESLMNINAVTMSSVINLLNNYKTVNVHEFQLFLQRIQTYDICRVRKLSEYAATSIDTTNMADF